MQLFPINMINTTLRKTQVLTGLSSLFPNQEAYQKFRKLLRKKNHRQSTCKVARPIYRETVCVPYLCQSRRRDLTYILVTCSVISYTYSKNKDRGGPLLLPTQCIACVYSGHHKIQNTKCYLHITFFWQEVSNKSECPPAKSNLTGTVSAHL